MWIFIDFSSFLNQGFSCRYCDWHVHGRNTKAVSVKKSVKTTPESEKCTISVRSWERKKKKKEE